MSFEGPPASASNRPMQQPLVARMALFGTIQLLGSRLREGRSATRTLEVWCAENNLSPDPAIIAILGLARQKEPTRETLEHLRASADGVTYRQVALSCGDKVLSKAENWYVPERLGDEMNTLLKTTDSPFGKVVSPLNPHRILMGTTMLWEVLPEGWHRRLEDLDQWVMEQPPLTYDPARDLFEHQALLVCEDGLPIARVHEVYTMALLAAQADALRI